MTTYLYSCNVFFKKNGTFARLQLLDPVGDKLFAAADPLKDDTRVHGLVLFQGHQSSQFTGKQDFAVHSSGWKTVVLVGSSLKEAVVVVIDDYNAENNHLDSGSGEWS
ncbi:hypothetical protein FS749_012621 [Ceratobasidium sp. UAMH 11750]|nr:hypothetical protein FS749_012621 [Ceratobasidium sp. UAMH 11750]